MSRFIATVFYVGLMPFAPGTWGSLAALPLALLLFWSVGLWGFVVGIVVVFGIGWFATYRATLGAEEHDPGEIVIDEIVGQWLALLPLIYLLSNGEGWRENWVWLALGFVLFRLFDITKPSLIGWADRMGSALGVMLDDVIAGVFAAVALGLLIVLTRAVL